MDHNYNCGAVSFLQNIEHPISVARKVMETTPHVMLSGKGAYDFALKNGFKHTELLTDETKIINLNNDEGESFLESSDEVVVTYIKG